MSDDWTKRTAQLGAPNFVMLIRNHFVPDSTANSRMTDISSSVSTPEGIFQASAQGNATALEEFERRYGNWIRLWTLRTARRWNSQHQLEDLVGDVWLRLLKDSGKALRQFKWQGEGSDMAYLYTIASREVAARCATETGRTERLVPLTIEFPAREAGSSESNMIFPDAVGILRRELPPEHAERYIAIFTLYYRDGWRTSEIARIASFGLSQAGVETALHGCRKILRNLLI